MVVLWVFGFCFDVGFVGWFNDCVWLHWQYELLQRLLYAGVWRMELRFGYWLLAVVVCSDCGCVCLCLVWLYC